jgi:hypothetical protein
MLVGFAVDDMRVGTSSTPLCIGGHSSLFALWALHHTLFPTMFLMMPLGAAIAFVVPLVLFKKRRHPSLTHLLGKHLRCLVMMSGGMLIFMWPAHATEHTSITIRPVAMAIMMLVGMLAGKYFDDILSSSVATLVVRKLLHNDIGEI